MKDIRGAIEPKCFSGVIPEQTEIATKDRHHRQVVEFIIRFVVTALWVLIFAVSVVDLRAVSRAG